jgi:hypothetical protein
VIHNRIEDWFYLTRDELYQRLKTESVLGAPGDLVHKYDKGLYLISYLTETKIILPKMEHMPLLGIPVYVGFGSERSDVYDTVFSLARGTNHIGDKVDDLISRFPAGSFVIYHFCTGIPEAYARAGEAMLIHALFESGYRSITADAWTPECKCILNKRNETHALDTCKEYMKLTEKEMQIYDCN